MLSTNICREQILSEDYQDFIIRNLRSRLIADRDIENLCMQEAGFEYRCVYLPKKETADLSLANYPYTSIPKCYVPLSLDALNQAGISPVQNYPTLQLMGKNVMIGFLDSGIDYQSRIFQNLDKTTRIAAIWDQTTQTGSPPNGFSYGSEYSRDAINQALGTDNPLETVPVTDETGHGTFVASLAAGGGIPEENFLGAAPESTLAVVKVKPPKEYLRAYYFLSQNAVCYGETDLILGLRYLVELAHAQGLPLVLCIALGTASGGHTGALPFSLLLDAYSLSPNIIPVTGTGNEADKRRHFQGQITESPDKKTVEISVSENMPGFTTELWSTIPNIFSVSLTSPSGETTPPIAIRTNKNVDFQFLLEKTRVTLDFSIPVEQTSSELIFFRFQDPVPGNWKIDVIPVQIADGIFHCWLPLTDMTEGDVFFLDSSPYDTITEPGNSTRPIVASFYDGGANAVALSSGRGRRFPRESFPTLTAPGINVKGVLPNQRTAIRSGASPAVGLTAGAAALLLEWAMYQEKAVAIDVEQIKSLLILGAIRQGGMAFPNQEWGYGQLNLYNTFEQARQF